MEKSYNDTYRHIACAYHWMEKRKMLIISIDQDCWFFPLPIFILRGNGGYLPHYADIIKCVDGIG